MINEKKLWSLTFVLLSWAILSTMGFTYFYHEYDTYYGLYQDSSKKLSSKEITIDLLIKYDDGEEFWYNGTKVQLGASLLDLTQQVVDVDFESFSFGAYVKKIGGVGGSPKGDVYWYWWVWDDSMGWLPGEVGADQFKLRDGNIVSWHLQDGESVNPPG